MTDPVFVGVDVGTSSSKGVLVSRSGEILRSAVRSHEVNRPSPGHFEMDPDVWWQEFQAIVAELTGDLSSLSQNKAVEVAAVGVSGMGPCVVLTNEWGDPVRPGILYGVDSRARDQITVLDAEMGRDEIRQRCGSALSSQAAGPKILWVRDNEPEVYGKARKFFMPASFLVHKLTGAYVLDHHSASQSTPLYDPRTHEWIPEWADRVAPGIELPRLQWAGELAGRTTVRVAGVPEGTPVVTGTIDAWAEGYSAGAHRPGDLMLMYGTTMFLISTVTEPLISDSMWGTVGVLPGTHCLAGGMATSGAITGWVRDLTGADYPQLIHEAAGSPPGANGLMVLPYFAGERTPVQDPDARGVIAGLTLNHTRGDMYRAVLEATAYGVRHNLEVMRAAGADVDRVVAVGGGTQSSLWPQIVTDVTGLPQMIPSVTIGASYGAAALAAGMVIDIDLDSWNPPGTECAPELEATEVYNALYSVYRDLYPATQEVVHTLVNLTTS